MRQVSWPQHDNLTVMVGGDVVAGRGRQHGKAVTLVTFSLAPEPGYDEEGFFIEGEAMFCLRIFGAGKLKKRRGQNAAAFAFRKVPLF